MCEAWKVCEKALCAVFGDVKECEKFKYKSSSVLKETIKARDKDKL